MATISFGTFNAIVDSIADARFPVLMRGRHGIGKSQLVYQFAGRRTLDVIERRASQMTEGDLIGLPNIEGRSTKWNPPDWFKTACDIDTSAGGMEKELGIVLLKDL